MEEPFRKDSNTSEKKSIIYFHLHRSNRIKSNAICTKIIMFQLPILLHLDLKLCAVLNLLMRHNPSN